jgi:hypothetical protein
MYVSCLPRMTNARRVVHGAASHAKLGGSRLAPWLPHTMVARQVPWIPVIAFDCERHS